MRNWQRKLFRSAAVLVAQTVATKVVYRLFKTKPGRR